MLLFSLGNLLLLVLLVGLIIGQYFLSRMQSRWPGLILPGIILLISIADLLFHLLNTQNLPFSSVFGAAFGNLLLQNIPTLLLLLIYLVVRERARCRRTLNRMNAQDLE